MVETFSQRLKRLRENKGWSYSELGRRAGVSYKAICLWERGTRSPSAIHLQALAGVFSMTMDDLWKGPGSER